MAQNTSRLRYVRETSGFVCKQDRHSSPHGASRLFIRCDEASSKKHVIHDLSFYVLVKNLNGDELHQVIASRILGTG